METIVFVGIQASGKSTFYRERFFDTHVRISLDMLRTRNRERILLEACLAARQPFVVDNTNPRADARARYVAPARAAGFRVVGYYFRTPPGEALQRNQQRTGKQLVPVAGVLGTYKRLQPPRLEEGFDALYLVRVDPGGGFSVEEWDGGS